MCKDALQDFCSRQILSACIHAGDAANDYRDAEGRKRKAPVICIDGPEENGQPAWMDNFFSHYPRIVLAGCDDVDGKQPSSLYKNVSRKDIFLDDHKALFVMDEARFN